MSTKFYPLRSPITNLALDLDAGHDRVSIWENGALAGTLTLSQGEGKTIARMFCENEPVLTRSYGGDAFGQIITKHGPDINNDTTVVSEYGEVTTVARIIETLNTKRL